jgi:hypothetical protein
MLMTVAGGVCAMAGVKDNRRGRTDRILTSKFFKGIFTEFLAGL